MSNVCGQLLIGGSLSLKGKTMPVTVFLSTTLRDCVPGYNPVEGAVIDADAPLTVADLAVRLGLPVKEIKIVMINGRHAGMDDILSTDDRVGLFPAVGGG